MAMVTDYYAVRAYPDGRFDIVSVRDALDEAQRGVLSGSLPVWTITGLFENWLDAEQQAGFFRAAKACRHIGGMTVETEMLQPANIETAAKFY